MAYHITEGCISCGSCEPECPNKAISEGKDIYIINPDFYTECVGSYESSRCAEVCPADACHTDPLYVEDEEQLIMKWQALHSLW
jgi:ferredoxin